VQLDFLRAAFFNRRSTITGRLIRVQSRIAAMKRLLLLTACALFLTFAASSASADCLLTFQTEVLPPLQAGVPYNFQIEAVSGTEPYTFEVYEGLIPEGLHLSPKGRITGKIDEPMDTTIWVTLRDDAGCHVTSTFTLQVF
jgi:Putative Ig domain